MNILIISNGLGEDVIACNLISAIKKQNPESRFDIIPLVGQGLHYKKISLEPKLKNTPMPSGGFIRSLKDLIIDLRAGLLGHHLRQLKTIKQCAKHCDLTISVGDVFCFLLGSYRNKTPHFFLPTAKSDRFMPHSFFEKWLLKKYSKAVFPRDKLTTDSLRDAGINTQFFGNPMMDNLKPKGIAFPLSKKDPVIALLPGSREEAYSNFSYLLTLVETLLKSSPRLQFIASLAPTLSLKKIRLDNEEKGWVLDKKESYAVLQHPHHGQVIITEEFPDVIAKAQVAIGLAGTANEQFIYSEKPVICFEGFGPQSTRLRFEEQEKLLGEQLHFIRDRDPDIIAKAVLSTIDMSLTAPPEIGSASTDIVAWIFDFISTYK